MHKSYSVRRDFLGKILLLGLQRSYGVVLACYVHGLRVQGLRARGVAVDRAGAPLGGHHHIRRPVHPGVPPPRLGLHCHQHGRRVSEKMSSFYIKIIFFFK